LTQLLDILQGKKLLVVTGKGGVGKTLFSAALGLHLNSVKKQRILLVESTPRSGLRPLVWGEERAPDVSSQEEWDEKTSLGLANLSLGGNLRDYISKHLKMAQLADFLANQNLARKFFDAVPGFGELLMLGRLYYACTLAPAPKPDLIILDGFASGHLLSLLQTPDAVISSGLSGPMVQDTLRVRDFLRSDQCAAIYTLIPEDLSVSETLEFIPKLSPHISVCGLLINRVMQNIETNDAEQKTFIQRKIDLQTQALNDLSTGDKPVFRARDMGFVKNPLSPEFLNHWLLEGAL
jgi:hypothetical protein